MSNLVRVQIKKAGFGAFKVGKFILVDKSLLDTHSEYLEINNEQVFPQPKEWKKIPIQIENKDKKTTIQTVNKNIVMPANKPTKKVQKRKKNIRKS